MKKAVVPEKNGASNYIWRTWNGPQRLGNVTGRTGIHKKGRNHPNKIIVENGQCTEKVPGDQIDLLSFGFQWKIPSQCRWEKISRTSLIQKDPEKRNHPQQLQTNNVPTMICKILTVQIREEIYHSLMSHGLFPKEMKGCTEGTRGTGDVQFIHEHILNDRKTRWKIKQ